MKESKQIKKKEVKLNDLCSIHCKGPKGFVGEGFNLPASKFEKPIVFKGVKYKATLLPKNTQLASLETWAYYQGNYYLLEKV
jgi:hypothetical protein